LDTESNQKQNRRWTRKTFQEIRNNFDHLYVSYKFRNYVNLPVSEIGLKNLIYKIGLKGVTKNILLGAVFYEVRYFCTKFGPLNYFLKRRALYHFKKNWTKFEPNCNRISTKFQQNFNKIWAKFEPNLNQIWTKFEQNLNKKLNKIFKGTLKFSFLLPVIIVGDVNLNCLIGITNSDNLVML